MFSNIPLKGDGGDFGLRTKRGVRQHPTLKGISNPLLNNGRLAAFKPWPIRPHFHGKKLRSLFCESPLKGALWAWPARGCRLRSTRNKRLRILKYILKTRVSPDDIKIISRLTRSSWELFLAFVRKSVLPSVAFSTDNYCLTDQVGEMDSFIQPEAVQSLDNKELFLDKQKLREAKRPPPKKGKEPAQIQIQSLTAENLEKHNLQYGDPHDHPGRIKPEAQRYIRLPYIKEMIKVKGVPTPLYTQEYNTLSERDWIASHCCFCNAPCPATHGPGGCAHRCWLCRSAGGFDPPFGFPNHIIWTPDASRDHWGYPEDIQVLSEHWSQNGSIDSDDNLIPYHADMADR
jgi:ribosomal protein S15P/S13E